MQFTEEDIMNESFTQAWKLHKRNQTLDMMDHSLAETAITDQVALCIHIALLCTQADPKLRPDMSRLVIILSKKKNTYLEQPTKPGFPGSSNRRSKLRQQGTSSHSHGQSSHQTVSGSGSSCSTDATHQTASFSSQHHHKIYNCFHSPCLLLTCSYSKIIFYLFFNYLIIFLFLKEDTSKFEKQFDKKQTLRKIVRQRGYFFF